MSAFVDQLNLMWQLRELDARVFAAVSRAALAARDAANAAASEAYSRKKLDEAKARLRDLQKRERDTEVEIKTLQKRLQLLEESANSATSDSIRKHSIEALEKERQALDNLENAGLALLDDIEKAQAAIQSAEAVVAAAAAKALEAKTHHDQLAVVAGAAESEARPPRDGVTATMQAELLTAYESARAKHPDSPICGIKDGYCEGCSGELTLHHGTRVRARNEIMRCPHCGRIHDAR